MDVGGVESEANVTEIHEALHFDQMHGRQGSQARLSLGLAYGNRSENAIIFMPFTLTTRHAAQGHLDGRLCVRERTARGAGAHNPACHHISRLAGVCCTVKGRISPQLAVNKLRLKSQGHFGIWSLRWAQDGREIVAGTGNHSIYVFDMEKQKARFLRLCALQVWDCNCCLSFSSRCRLSFLSL